MSETIEAQEKFFNKQDLVHSVMEKAELPRAKALAAVQAVFETLSHNLTSGQEVRLMGFGSFFVAERKAGKGLDSRTGAQIDIPASKSVRFRAGKALRESVAGTPASAEPDDEAEAEAEVEADSAPE